MSKFLKWHNALFLTALFGSAVAGPFKDPDIFVSRQQIVQDPWLTGPLLAAAGVTVPKGHFNLEPYLFLNDTFGIYTHNWGTRSISSIKAVNPVLVLTQGISKRLDVQASIPYEVNYVRNQSYDGWGDVFVLLGIQAIRSDRWPNLRITIGEIFPSGQFDNLDVDRMGADSVGAGSYQTAIAANFQKSFSVRGSHTFRTRLNVAYVIPTPVNTHGFNAHTGSIPLEGRVDLGNRFNVITGFEYTITQRWVPALDIQYHYESSSKFSGFHKFYNTTRVSGSSGSSVSISLAPAIEYNFSSALGVIFGAWFSVAGRNANEFASAVFAINYYI